MLHIFIVAARSVLLNQQNIHYRKMMSTVSVFQALVIAPFARARAAVCCQRFPLSRGKVHGNLSPFLANWVTRHYLQGPLIQGGARRSTV